MKLLIADDDLTSRTILASVTRKWGFDPVEAEDGLKAWQLLQQDDAPQLLLLDWEMPGIDGLTLCQRVRQQAGDEPRFIIMLTARSKTEDIVKGLGAGANDYIAKPFEIAELQARLQVAKRMLELQQELLRMKDHLMYQANHDELTGLMNRRAVMDALTKEVARSQRQHQPLCIGLCDVDHFKQINDSHGHLTGDQVLQQVSKRMSQTLRPYDHIGRYGGEEFLIVLTAEHTQGFQLFERIRHAISDQSFEIDELSLEITMSIGVVLIDPDDTDLMQNSLLAQADEILYAAKDRGRNCTLVAREPDPA
ncbi:GGDEF domain-containing response regulator [Marinobacterium jannaschii]|uniref:GGDEF domain-containing response regulator n=1 Tax=Marinobacterium jannaschii TaxID=64970 RepID=UPI000485DF18|nr:diguanylate cyclase [Marinobacterium jannaschii]